MIDEIIRQAQLDFEEVINTTTCSISHTMMNNPALLLGDGKVYEQALIAEHIAKRNFSPLIGVVLDDQGKRVVPIAHFKETIDAIRKFEVTFKRLISSLEPAQSPKEKPSKVVFFRPNVEHSDLIRQFEMAYSRKITHLTAEANTNNPNAQAQLGKIYLMGRGVTTHNTQALYWLKKASRFDCAPGYWALGLCHEKGLFGLGENLQKAITFYKKADELAYLPASVSLGLAYLKEGSDKAGIAAALFRKAAQEGEVSANVALGRCYQQGLGFSIDHEQAVISYQHAMREGHLGAVYYLALCYLNGEGIARNHAIANTFAEIAATYGCREAETLQKQIQNPSSHEEVPNRCICS